MNASVIPPRDQRQPGQCVGYLRCPFAGEVAEVKVNKKLALYYHCPGSGPVQIHGHAGQAGLEAQTVASREQLTGERPPSDREEPTEEAPRRRGMLGGLVRDDDDDDD